MLVSGRVECLKIQPPPKNRDECSNPIQGKRGHACSLRVFKFIYLYIQYTYTHKYIDRVSLISLTSDTSLKSPWHPSCFLHPAASTTLRLRRSRVRFPSRWHLPTPRGPYVTPAMPQWREFPKRWSKRKRFDGIP